MICLEVSLNNAFRRARPSPAMRRGSFAAFGCLLLAVSGHAQDPAVNPGGRGARGESAAIAGAKEDPVAVDRGAKLYATHCACCHGNTARGNPGAPDLIRSMVVLTDE